MGPTSMAWGASIPWTTVGTTARGPRRQTPGGGVARVGDETGGWVNMAGGAPAGDSAVGFENAKGTEFADSFTGNEASNTLKGAKGQDNIRGGSGDDTLGGGGGNDVMRGGSD